MLIEIRQKSQITIPKEIIKKLDLREGDSLEISEDNGIIRLIPVAIYPKKYVDELKDEIMEIKEKIASGTQPVFDNVDDLFAELDRRNG